MKQKALFLLLSLAAPCFAQVQGKANSDALFRALLEGGLSPVAQYFTEPNDGFPYNILLPFDSRNPDPSVNAAGIPPTLLLVFSQEEWAEHIERLIDFLLQFQQNSPAGHTEFLLSAGDNPLRRSSPQGTQIYLEQGEGGDNRAVVALVILVNREFQRPPEILPGTSGITAPLSLIRQIPFPIAGASTAFYRFGLAGKEKRLEVFKDEEIPAAAILVNPDYPGSNEGISALFDGLAPLISHFEFPDPTKADMNYSLVPNAIQAVYVGERGFLISYLICLALGILMLCIRSRKDLQFLPLFIVVTFVSLILATALSQAIISSSKGVLLPILGRILVPFFLLSFLSIAVRRKWPRITFEYGLLISLQALVNLFIFGSLDFFLLVIFGGLLLITQFLRHSRQPVAFFAAGILSFCVYIPMILSLIRNADRETLRHLAITGPLFPAIATFLILPFLLMWLEILKGLKWPLMATAGAAALFLLGGMVSSRFLSLRNAPRYSTLPAITLDSRGQKGDAVTVDTAREFFFNEYEIVTVTAKSALPLVCLDVFVTGLGNADKNTPAPAFITSPDPFASSTTGENLSFLPPEFPPNPLSFSYTVPQGTATEIHAVFYLLEENNTILQESVRVKP